MISVLVGLPTGGLGANNEWVYRGTPPEWGIGLASLRFPNNTGVTFLPVRGKPIAEARNEIADTALNLHSKYCWMIDSDVGLPLLPNPAEQLLYTLEQSALIDPAVMAVTGIYCTRENIPTPLVFRDPDGSGPFWRWKEGDVFPIDWAGAGCLLIRTEAFRLMEPPWFLGPSGLEDVFFFRKLKRHGFKAIADGSVLCTHWDMERNPPRPCRLPLNSYPFQATAESEFMAIDSAITAEA